MASGPITSWPGDGQTMPAMADFIFLAPESLWTVTAARCLLKDRRLLLFRKAMMNLDSILKSRDITFPTKVCIIKAIVFQ